MSFDCSHEDLSFTKGETNTCEVKSAHTEKNKRQRVREWNAFDWSECWKRRQKKGEHKCKVRERSRLCSLSKLRRDGMMYISLLHFSVSEESHFCKESPSAHFILWGECTSESIYAMCMCCCKVQRSETWEGKRERERERERRREETQRYRGERERKWIGLWGNTA